MREIANEGNRGKYRVGLVKVADRSDNPFDNKDELLDSVIAHLRPLPDEAEAHLRRDLARIGCSYLSEKFARDYDGDAKTQKAAIRKLIAKLDAVLLARSSITPEYWVAITGMQCKSDHTPSLDPCDATHRLREAAALFLSNYEVPRGARVNIALEEAIRDLQFCFDELEIELTFDAKKHGVGGPQPNSPGAAAAIELLRGIDPSLSVTTIANMIGKVRHQPQPSQSHLGSISTADPSFELDVSLLPGRRGK